MSVKLLSGWLTMCGWWLGLFAGSVSLLLAPFFAEVNPIRCRGRRIPPVPSSHSLFMGDEIISQCAGDHRKFQSELEKLDTRVKNADKGVEDDAFRVNVIHI